MTANHVRDSKGEIVLFVIITVLLLLCMAAL